MLQSHEDGDAIALHTPTKAIAFPTPTSAIAFWLAVTDKVRSHFPHQQARSHFLLSLSSDAVATSS